ncbi:MAG: ABC transporter permease [Actinobacteria bacterium]|nr:ABC transporter permease [Actinomycetota bacterium]
MKLLSSFKKELILASRGFYFYVELVFALVLLAVLLFAIPQNFSSTSTEYLYFNLPQQGKEIFINNILEDDLDAKSEIVEIEADGKTFDAELIVTDEQEIYIVDSEEAVRTLADSERVIGAVIELNDKNQLYYKYYLQGYESTRLKNLISILNNERTDVLEERINNQDVRPLSTGYEPLNDRENTIPPLIAFSGSLMGMFIMASYIFLDKKEGVIEAYAVTPSSVWRYLMSKILVVSLTSVVSGLIIIMPIMGFRINYGLLLLLLLTTGFFASSLGLLVASFYNNLMKAFGVIYLLIIILMVPSIAYFIPGWDPVWIKIIPSYPLLQGFKEIILPNGDIVYPLIASAGFLAVGVVLFAITNIRFKKTLSV